MTQKQPTMKDCETCKRNYCTTECFDNHPGSQIAILKLMKEIKETRPPGRHDYELP